MGPHAGQPVLSAGAPLGEGRAVMIMVHGRNAAPRNILDLATHLDCAGFTYLAPAAANNTWYPLSFMAATEQNEPGLSSGLEVIGRLVGEAEAKGIPRDRVMLLGFSQGACLASEFAVRNPSRFGGLIVFSGGLIGPPGTTWNETGHFAGTPVFLGCSDSDSHIPKARVEDSAAVLARMGATVTLRLYPGMGHLINDDELATARSIMNGVVA